MREVHNLKIKYGMIPIHLSSLIGRGAVGDAEVEAEDLPGALVVQDDALGAEVAVQHLDAVVQEVQTLAQLLVHRNIKIGS